MTVTGTLGDANMQENVYGPLLARMANHQPCSLQELEDALKGAGIGFGAVLQVVLILVGKSVLEPVQDDATVEAAVPASARLNRKLCEQVMLFECRRRAGKPIDWRWNRGWTYRKAVSAGPIGEHHRSGSDGTLYRSSTSFNRRAMHGQGR